MNTSLLNQIVEAVLYEGYMLYPYRPSSKKNRERFTFGRVYPQSYSLAQDGAEPCVMQTECLLRAKTPSPEVRVTVRFLQPLSRDVGVFNQPLAHWPQDPVPPFQVVPKFEVDGHVYHSWMECAEREISVSSKSHTAFSLPAQQAFEPIAGPDGRIIAIFARRQEAMAGAVELTATPVDAEVVKLTVRIINHSPLSADDMSRSGAVLMRTFASTHTILHAPQSEFLSLTDPPAPYQAAAAACKNVGAWPVLVGDETNKDCDTLLSSPIILSDYPRIAPESPGNLFDGTEIDEILSLRILTMTDDEKREMRDVDARARMILERTESLGAADQLQMHGAMRDAAAFDPDFFSSNDRLEGVTVGDVYLKAGDAVRIRPKVRADVMDIALAGKAAVIDAVEQDAEGKVHLALVLQDDPGRDLGHLRQPGHRFFYGVDEIEPLRERP